MDRNRQPGRFLLTGSADVLLLRHLSESLTGRMEILTLCPFSENELTGNEQSLVDLLFAAGPLPKFCTDLSRDALLKRMVTGGLSRGDCA